MNATLSRHGLHQRSNATMSVVLNLRIKSLVLVGLLLITKSVNGILHAYTVNHKKGGSTFVIITLENLDGF